MHTSKTVSTSTVVKDSYIPEELTTKTINKDWQNTFKLIILHAASSMTDPICKVREYFYSFYTLKQICISPLQKIRKIGLLTLGLIAYSLLTPLLTPLGIALRGIVSSWQSKPYVYLKKANLGKILPDNKIITLVSHNQCYMPAGYSITDGQVTPPSDTKRLDTNIQKIKSLDPDIICLFEVPDIKDASYLSSNFSAYPFLLPVAGIRAIGPSSMIYIASKYEIIDSSIEFIPFKKGIELTGRSQHSEKGYVSFDIKSPFEEKPFATIVATHLQHSEIPEIPEESEKASRAKQLLKIVLHIQKKVESGFNVIFTGDLNLAESELNAFLAEHKIHWLRRDLSIQGKPTWGGDLWCSKLMKKTASGPLVLDYTFIAGSAKKIDTNIHDTGYNATEFKPEALSDHALLFSSISCGDCKKS